MNRPKVQLRSNPIILLTLSLWLLLTLIGTSCGGENSSLSEKSKTTNTKQVKAVPQDHTAVAESVEKEVDTESDGKLAEKRKKIIEEAKTALSETHKALRALHEKKTNEALAALEKATGKLELILAREPSLALAPTKVTSTTLDLLTSLEVIKKARDEAEDAMEDGDIQKARGLLSRLGSEIVISVTNIPLASYPVAIKAITPLIDDGKIEEAKTALAAALNTLVVTKHVIPLPVVRASAMLTDAEKLTEQKDREEEDNKKLSSLLENARYQLEMAEALGYGQKEDYEKFYEQLQIIEKKTEGSKSGKGLFDQLNSRIEKMTKSIFK